MKKSIFLFAFIFLSAYVKAQNLPACDTLIINCCTLDSVGPNTVTLHASNYSSVLFDYPGFVLFDTNMDTIAKEVVYYFGIGQYPQLHTLDVVAPLNLPFTGYLNLYTLFYDSFACSFPVTIADTAAGIHLMEISHDITVYPNPALDEVTIEVTQFITGRHLSLTVFDVLGNELQNVSYDVSPLQLSLQEMKSGLYILRIADFENEFQQFSVLVHQ